MSSFFEDVTLLEERCRSGGDERSRCRCDGKGKGEDESEDEGKAKHVERSRRRECRERGRESGMK